MNDLNGRLSPEDLNRARALGAEAMRELRSLHCEPDTVMELGTEADFHGGWGVPRVERELRAQLREALAERDRARATAVALEQELAAAEEDCAELSGHLTFSNNRCRELERAVHLDWCSHSGAWHLRGSSCPREAS